MEIKKIMDADILDIIFEGRNKDYGAYDLRRSYNRRLIKALMSTAFILILLFTGYFLSGMKTHETKKPMAIADIDLNQIRQEQPDPPSVPPPKVEPIKVQMTQFTPPQIVKDQDVR